QERPHKNGNHGPFREGTAGRNRDLALLDERVQPRFLIRRDQDRNFDQRDFAEEIHAADYTTGFPACQFTRWGAFRPSSTAVMLSATIRPIFTLVSVVAEPMCGKSTVLGSASKRGWTCGSCWYTSRPAPANRPCSRASASAASSTTGPRAVLMR